jgi:hypothetical protein
MSLGILYFGMGVLWMIFCGFLVFSIFKNELGFFGGVIIGTVSYLIIGGVWNYG